MLFTGRLQRFDVIKINSLRTTNILTVPEQSKLIELKFYFYIFQLVLTIMTI